MKSHPLTLSAYATQTTVHASQYALFNHPHLLIQVTQVQKGQFPYRPDWPVP